MPETILGLDIADSSLKAVQVTGGLRGSKVAACASVEIGQDQGLEDALKTLFEQVAFDGGACIASFQADRVSYRNLKMPFRDRKKIAQTIGYELEPMLPFPAESVTTSYVLAEHSEQPRVLAASIHHEALEQCLAALASQNVDPDVVDLSSVSTAIQVLKHDHEASDALFIDMGSRVTTAVVLISRAVVLVRSFHFGGHTITEAIASSKKITHAEAEGLKCNGDTNGLADVVGPVVQAFCAQINNTLHAFRFEEMEEANPKIVFLTGGGALYPQMAGMLEDFLELPVKPVDLAKQTGLEMEQDASSQWNPLLMNSALALALRDTKAKEGFNFRAGKFGKRKRYEQFSQEIKRVAIYAAIILLVMIANISADYYVTQNRHERLQVEITSVFKKTFPEVQRIVDPVQQMKVKIREAKESTLLPSETFVRTAVADVVRDIALRMPKTANVDVSSLIIDEERVRLKGHTDTFNTVDAVKNGLQESTYFEDVAIASAQLDRTGDRVRFELVMGRK